MGLDCSHDAFTGAYSAFNRLRQFVCAAAGGSFPPHCQRGPNGYPLEDERGHVLMRDIPMDQWVVDDEYQRSEWPGLYEFLEHSDCDGEIDPAMCVKVADDLERLMPKMEALGWASHGHIEGRGGFVEVVRKFIAGCRAAAAANEPLEFL